MIKHIPNILLIFLFVFQIFLFKNALGLEKDSTSTTIPKLAAQLVKQGAPLIDVRTPEEYQSKHIKNAHSIPLQEISQQISKIENLVSGDKNKPIVVYCRSGRRAGLAKELLLKNGFTNIINLGGIDDWPEEN